MSDSTATPGVGQGDRPPMVPTQTCRTLGITPFPLSLPLYLLYNFVGMDQPKNSPQLLPPHLRP